MSLAGIAISIWLNILGVFHTHASPFELTITGTEKAMCFSILILRLCVLRCKIECKKCSDSYKVHLLTLLPEQTNQNSNHRNTKNNKLHLPQSHHPPTHTHCKEVTNGLQVTTTRGLWWLYYTGEAGVVREGMNERPWVTLADRWGRWPAMAFYPNKTTLESKH